MRETEDPEGAEPVLQLPEKKALQKDGLQEASCIFLNRRKSALWYPQNGAREEAV